MILKLIPHAHTTKGGWTTTITEYVESYRGLRERSEIDWED